jgi:alkylation response protein AidB-like acyl-CoA dehydrogenase
MDSNQQEFVDAVETWVEKELKPVARELDNADEYPHAIVEQMKELGLFGATIGEAYGGLGLSAWTYAQIVIKVASVWMAPLGHLQFAPDHGLGDRAQRHRGAEAQVPAEDGER